MNDQEPQELISHVRWMVYHEDPIWYGDAKILIDAGMNLQAMDTYLCHYFQLKLGLQSVEDKIAAIAEFHRQVLERMGLPIPARGLDPDPIALSFVHQMPPFRGDPFKEGTQGDPNKKSSWYQFTDAELHTLHDAMLRKRPELIRAIELSWLDWIHNGRPNDGGLIAALSRDGMETFVLNQRADIGTMDAGRAGHIIADRYNPL